METRLIMLDNPILVSDEEVNPHNAVWDFENNQVTVLRQSYGLTNYKKIVAGLPDLPKLDLSLIAEGIGWVDVYKLAKESKCFENSSLDETSYLHGFTKGFKAAQSLNEKKFSEEDMIEFAHFCRDYFTHLLTINEKFNLWYFNRKPKGYLVEVSVENSAIKDFLGHPVISEAPKITNNTITVTKVLKQ